MDLKEALEDIRQREGRLTPSLVVEEARAQATPAGALLHSRLEWRNDVAADAHRLTQARELIRSLRVVYREATETEPARSVRAYHSLNDANGYHYEPAHEVADDPMSRAIALRDMEREWKALYRRWSEFAEFVEVVSATLGAEAA